MDKNWFNKSKEDIFQEFGISEDVGLNPEQVIQNRERRSRIHQ